jgi:hypothetical protein
VVKGKLASLCLFQTAEKPAHLHVAFAADTRQQVDAFYRAALRPVARTTARPVCARTTTPTTTPRSSSTRTGTTSRRSAISPMPEAAPQQAGGGVPSSIKAALLTR